MAAFGQHVLAKHSRLFAVLIIVIVAHLPITQEVIFGYVTDGAIYLPPGYATFTPPPAGGSYTDPVFGTAIKRVSDAMRTTDVARGGLVTTIQTEYSTMSAFNSDSTRLLIQHFSYFALYDGAGNFIRNLLEYDISASTEPRWSRTDPFTFYYIVGNQLKSLNVGTLTSSVVHTFSEYTRIRGEGESDISFDGRSFVLSGDHRYIFVYDIPANTKGQVLDAGPNGFDNIYITPDNNVLVSWYANGLNRFNGIELFNKNMTFVRQIAHAMGHMDVTRDTDGQEIVVWANAADAQLQVPCEAGVTKIRLSDGKQTCVFKGNWNWHLAYHISAPDQNGWFFMETYAPSDPIPPVGWNPYTNEILQVKLDGSEIRRLAHHRSRPVNSYVYQPRVSTNREGTKIVYSSNFSLQSIFGYPTNYSDVYLADIPFVTPRRASDSFNRADGPLGANWSGLGAGSLMPVIRSRRAGTDSASTSNRTARYSGITWGDNQASRVIFPVLPYRIGMAAVRMQRNANSYYAGGFDNNNFNNAAGTYRCRIVKYVNGIPNSLALDNNCIIRAGDRVRIDAVGPTLSLYLNGVLKLTTSDSTYRSGSPGFTFNYNQTNASIVDDWVGLTLP